MLFFRRILKKADLGHYAQGERRNSPRYVINPDFNLRGTLGLMAKERSSDATSGAEPTVNLTEVKSTNRARTNPPAGNPRPEMLMPCRILDLSDGGVRLRLEQGIRVEARHLCELRLAIEDFQFTLPCRISHARAQADGLVLGLRYDALSGDRWNACCQLLEVVALGATLRLQRRGTEPGESGYYEESYVNNRPARLSIWRHPVTREVSAMEFRLHSHLVRQLAENQPELLTGSSNRPATEAQADEIRRLFKWVVQNLSEEIPWDIRNFLRNTHNKLRAKAP